MMELVWGIRVAPQNAKWITATDSTGARKSCRFDLRPLRRIFLAFFGPATVRIPALTRRKFLSFHCWKAVMILISSRWRRIV